MDEDPHSLPPGADARFAPGAKIAGRYRIVNLIGEGAIGEVYEAFDEALGEPMALKTCTRRSPRTRSRSRGFRREIQLARKVTHRNVCRTFDLGRHEMPDGTEVTFLTMELLRGVSLRQRYMSGQGRFTTEEALPLVVADDGGAGSARTRRASSTATSSPGIWCWCRRPARARRSAAPRDHRLRAGAAATASARRASPAPASRSARRFTWRRSR